MSLISGNKSFFGAPPFPFIHDTWRGGQFPHYPPPPPGMTQTRIDWDETPESHVFRADLPGFAKQDVRVEIEEAAGAGRVLCISGEKKVEKEEKTETGHRVERAVGKFTRRFHLPENAMANRMTAHMQNSTLTVTVPKRDVVKKHSHVHARRSINITG